MHRLAALLARPLHGLLQWLIALVVLFEEWGWDTLLRGMAWLAQWPPVGWLERRIARLAPWPARLVFSWRQATFPPDLHTEVEVCFEAVGDETRVSVEHRGFDRVPADSAARHRFPDAYLLQRLAEIVALIDYPDLRLPDVA